MKMPSTLRAYFRNTMRIADPKKDSGRYSKMQRKKPMDLKEQGLLIIDDRGLRLTEQGIDISNSIMSLFV